MKKFIFYSIGVFAIIAMSTQAAFTQSCDTLRNYNPNDQAYEFTSGVDFPLGQDTITDTGGELYELNYWSEPYNVGAATTVRAVGFVPWIAEDVGGVDSIAFYVWGDNGGVPDLTNELGKEWIRYDEVNVNGYNLVEFTTPAAVNGDFHVGYEVNYDALEDSFALLATQPTTSFTQFQAQALGAGTLDGLWFGMPFSYGANTAFLLDVLTSTGTAPTASFTYTPASGEVCLGSDFGVDGSSSTGDIDVYDWLLTNSNVTVVYDEDSGQTGTLTPTTSPSTQVLILFTDGACVFDFDFVPVSVYDAVDATVDKTDPTCGLDNGEINITAPSGGDGTYSYSIDGGVNTQTQTSYTGLAAGTYDVVVSTPGGGCEYTETVTLSAIAPETITVGGDETICNGDAVSITASGTGSIEWFDGGGNSEGTGGSISVSPTTTTVYDAVLTDANGCTATDQVEVTVNPVNDATFSYSSSTLCLGGTNETPTISGTGTFTSNPSTGLVFANANTGEINMSTSTAGSYDITFTTTGTCGETFTETITLTSSPNATFNYSASDFCAELGTEAPSFPSGSSAGTFSSTPAGLSINSANGTITLDASTANTYTVTNTIAATGSCSQSTFDQTVTINALPTVDAGTDQEVCDGTTVTLTATGADTYTWDNSVSQGVAFTPSVGVTTYTVTGVTTATGCENTDEVDVTVNEIPTVSGGADQEVCAGEEVTLTATTSAGTVSWDNSVTDGTPFTPTVTTTYTATADNNGCTATDEVVVTVNDLPTVDAGADEEACENHDPITLSGTPAGGTFSGTSVSGNDFDPSVGTGTYTVTYTYTDGNGCEASDDLTVTVDGCVSIEENNLSENITLMPNPATDFVDVVLEGSNTIKSIQVTSAEGKVVEVSTSSLNETTTRIDLNKVSNGTYLIQLNTTNGQVIRRVVVQ